MELEEVTAAIVVSVLSAIVSSIAGVVIYRARDAITANHKEADAIKDGVQAVLQDRLVSLMLEAEQKGFAPVQTVENVSVMLQAYKGLDGNGMVEGLYERFRKLPHVRLENERK